MYVISCFVSRANRILVGVLHTSQYVYYVTCLKLTQVNTYTKSLPNILVTPAILLESRSFERVILYFILIKFGNKVEQFSYDCENLTVRTRHAVMVPCPSILIGWEMLARYMIGWEDFLDAVPWPCRGFSHPYEIRSIVERTQYFEFV
jgi:hypothetical protein